MARNRKPLYIGVALTIMAVLFTYTPPAFSEGTTVDGYSGFIRVYGQSNINSFAFEYFVPEKKLNDTKGECDKDSTDGNGRKKRSITIPVRDFHADNRLMFNDFLSMMRESEYPDMKLALPCSLPDYLSAGDSIILKDVHVTIAGIEKAYDFRCVVGDTGADGVVIIGEQKLTITDFNLTPPRKTFGLIRVKDEIIVTFELEFNDAGE